MLVPLREAVFFPSRWHEANILTMAAVVVLSSLAAPTDSAVHHSSPYAQPQQNAYYEENTYTYEGDMRHSDTATHGGDAPYYFSDQMPQHGQPTFNDPQAQPPYPPAGQQSNAPTGQQHRAATNHYDSKHPQQQQLTNQTNQIQIEHIVVKAVQADTKPVLKGHGLFILGVVAAIVCLVAIYSDPAANGMGPLDAIMMNGASLVQLNDVARALLVILTAVMSPLLVVIGGVRLAPTLPRYIKWLWNNDEVKLAEIGTWLLLIWLSLLDPNGKQGKLNHSQGG